MKYQGIAAAAAAALLALPAQAAVQTSIELRAGLDPFWSSTANVFSIAGPQTAQSGSVSFNNGTSFSTAAGSASLARGTLGVFGVAGGPTPFTGAARATATFSDELRFSIAGANASTVTPISLAWTLHGDFRDRTNGAGSAVAELLLGPFNFAAMTISYNTNPVLQGTAQNLADELFVVDGETRRLTARYDLVGSNPVLPFNARLALNLVGGIRGDFGNTASFAVILPDNVSFTSESGVALTQGAVPEPESWVLLVAGFGVAGGMMRRRQRAAA